VCPATPSRLPEYSFLFFPLSSYFLLVALVTTMAVRFGDWRQSVPGPTA